MTTEAELYNALKYRMVTTSDGTRIYYNHAGQFHREDGPAVIYTDTSCFWYQNDLRHREDGPAAVWSDGDLHWFQQGLLHREDGPAVVRANGTVQQWYLRGVQYTEKQYHQQCKRLGLAGQTRNQYG